MITLSRCLCEAFCVSRSGFYDWLQRGNNPSARAKEDEQLAQQISEVHQQSRGTYGTPRLHAELRDRGHKHSLKRIDRIRRELGLSGRPKRCYGRLIAPMRNRSLLTGLPSGLKPAGAIHIGSEDAGPRVAAIISVVETCWRIKIPRDYLGSVLPGLGAFPITRIAELTPAAWATRN